LPKPSSKRTAEEFGRMQAQALAREFVFRCPDEWAIIKAAKKESNHDDFNY